jgi:hypothetical protein
MDAPKRESAGRRPPQKRRPRVSDDAVAEEILKRVDAAGEEGRVRPEDVARAILPAEWQGLLKRIRRQAVHFAHDGRVTILRKGKPADPDDFRGVYRLRVGPRGAWPEEEGGEAQDEARR